MMRFVRTIGAALGAILAISLAAASTDFFDPSPTGRVVLVGWIAAWTVLGYSILPHITVEPAARILSAATRLSAGEFVAAVAGLIVGLVMGVLLSLPMANFPEPYRWLLPTGVSIVFGLGMMGLTVAKRHELLDAAREAGLVGRAGRDPGDGEAALAHEAQQPLIYVDTSAIIDGRITDLVASGFVLGTLVVPRFVLAELQRIADQSDAGRRARGRRGMDILALLQKDPRASLELSDDDPRGVEAVDAKLVSLAVAHGAAVMTTDYNLDRIAQLQGVRVMNLNNLANALKPAFLPGEELRVKVVQPGKEPGQGVAYLEDGTMVVVEGGSSFLQHEMDVTVTRVLQTVAGRMVFAQPRP